MIIYTKNKQHQYYYSWYVHQISNTNNEYTSINVHIFIFLLFHVVQFCSSFDFMHIFFIFQILNIYSYVCFCALVRHVIILIHDNPFVSQKLVVYEIISPVSMDWIKFGGKLIQVPTWPFDFVLCLMHNINI